MDRRIPMIAGIAFAVLFAAALLMVPTLPGIDKPGYDIVAHVNEHSGAMRMQALVVTFGSLALPAMTHERIRAHITTHRLVALLTRMAPSKSSNLHKTIAVGFSEWTACTTSVASTGSVPSNTRTRSHSSSTIGSAAFSG
jgi:hypothetical protein